MNKTLSDVLEYLYKQGKKDLADVVLREMKKERIVEQVTVPLPQTNQPTTPYIPYTAIPPTTYC